MWRPMGHNPDLSVGRNDASPVDMSAAGRLLIGRQFIFMIWLRRATGVSGKQDLTTAFRDANHSSAPLLREGVPVGAIQHPPHRSASFY